MEPWMTRAARGSRPRHRAVLTVTISLLLALGTSSCVLEGLSGDSAGGGGLFDPQEPDTFATPLPVPPMAESEVVDGVRVFSLTAQEGEREFKPGVTTPTWGFDGDYLGPTLRARRGEQVAVEVTNQLPDTTTVHWHGMHLPAAMDGGPHQPIDPGESWRPTWVIDQPAATLWYHPHPHGATEEHVMRGLAGMFLLEDEVSDGLDLPDDYGVDDFPVVVQDKRFRSDGTFEFDSQGNEIGVLGDTILTNGAWGARVDVTTEQVRLRLLNGSTARTYAFALADGRNFSLIATDGGFLESPLATDQVRLSPGERAEIVVEMSPGEDVMLRSIPPDLGEVAAPAAYGGDNTFDVLLLSAAETLEPSAAPPDRLTTIERFNPSDADIERSFEMQDRAINGRSMSIDRIDEVMQMDTTEVWTVRNKDLFPHNWHVHDVQFQVVDIDGEQPPPELLGWKDTIYVEPRRDYRIAMRFEDYADEDNPYMIHCHLLLHEDEGLMAQFIVSTGAPSREAIIRESEEDHGH